MAREKPKTTLCTEEQLRAVIDAIPAHVWSSSPDGAVDFFNRRVLDYFGFRAEETLGWNWQRIVHPEDLARYVSDRGAAFASGQALEREIRLRRVDGQYRWYAAAFDIEDRKHAEEAALEQRLLERTRIARELHDTLLQSFQAVLLKFHVATYQLSDRPELQKMLEGLIDQARQAVTEGRDAVQGLRSSTVVTNDLAQAIRTLCAELADQGDMRAPVFRVNVEGTPRDLAPILRDDIYRIAGEAVRNAFQHAHAGSIEVQIQYDHRQLRLRIRDDGEGIDPKVLESGARAGHYGLPGLQERAKLVSGKLTVCSDPGSGTEIELTIPASVVYAASGVR
jgi:PAS domain S-box-containing protein